MTTVSHSIENRGCFPINWKLYAIPQDARIVLAMRKKVQRIERSLRNGVSPDRKYNDLLDRSGRIPEGFLPIIDLMILSRTPDLDAHTAWITQPLMLSVPTPILRVLGRI